MRTLVLTLALMSCSAIADETPSEPAKAAAERYCAAAVQPRKVVNALGDYDSAFTPPGDLKPAAAPIGRPRDAVITLAVIVEADGSISSAEVVHVSGDERNGGPAVKWALASRYLKPATLDGAPVRACTLLTLRLVTMRGTTKDGRGGCAKGRVRSTDPERTSARTRILHSYVTL